MWGKPNQLWLLYVMCQRYHAHRGSAIVPLFHLLQCNCRRLRNKTTRLLTYQILKCCFSIWLYTLTARTKELFKSVPHRELQFQQFHKPYASKLTNWNWQSWWMDTLLYHLIKEQSVMLLMDNKRYTYVGQAVKSINIKFTVNMA